MKKVVALILLVVMCTLTVSGFAANKERIVIYSCANETRIAALSQALAVQFPDYDIIVEYQSTSKLTAKLLAEGENTDCDIVHDLSFLNMKSLENANCLANVSWVDKTPFMDDCNVSDYYAVECRTSGGIIVNNDVLAKYNLEAPKSYEDLLKPEYKGLISMPDPKSSGTGYMFVKSWVNAWGLEKALEYGEKLADNILQFTASGNGPVNSLIQEEVAIALGLNQNAAIQMSEGANLQILTFEEGAPYSMYGQTIIAGKDERAAVKEVFKWMVEEYLPIDSAAFALEKVYIDYDYTNEFYPADIVYADMSNDTVEEKEATLDLWNIT